MAVDLSARQFADEGLVAKVRTVLAAAGIEAAALELEITETSVMMDVDPATRSLVELSALRVALAIDDSGTGYSSMAYLRAMPVTTLKIDMSFVRGIVDNPEDASNVRAVVALGRGLGPTVLAAGVETQASARCSRSPAATSSRATCSGGHCRLQRSPAG